MDHRRILLVALGVALALIAGSSPRLVGDGGEYLAQALRFPAVHGTHFWFYALLAAPLARLTRVAGVDSLWAFTALNLVLLGLALRVALPRIGLAACLLLFAGPVVWWLDKAHTEIFTFSLVMIAMALVRERPWWSMVAAGAASTQNPPIAALAGLVFLSQAVANRPMLRDKRFWAGAAGGLGLALLHPVYNVWRHGTPSPLLGAARLGLPSGASATAIVLDPDMGLIANYPALALAVLAALVVVWRAGRRELTSSDVQVAWMAGFVILLATGTANNAHHGGTPGISRYALWLVPLAVPLLRRADALGHRGWRFVIWGLAISSAVACGFMFHPKTGENSREPTALAMYLWTKHPAWNNPLPEVFSETILHIDDSWVPVASPGCEKILLAGRGTWSGVWPVPCYPEPIPLRCRESGALCYANLAQGRYEFTEAPGPRDPYKLRRQWVWPSGSEPHIQALFREWRWEELTLAPGGGEVLDVVTDVERAWTWVGPDRFLVVIVRPGAGARLGMPLTRPISGRLVDASTGSTVEDVRGGPSKDGRWELSLPPGHEVLVLAMRGR